MNVRKTFVVLFSFIVIVGLVACQGIEKSEKDVGAVELNDQEEAAGKSVEEQEANVAEAEEKSNKEEGTEEEKDEVEAKEFDKEIVDNDHVTVTLMSVEKIIDKDWDEERFEIKFEVKNKRDETIEVQAREVSADGKMVDESMILMSQTVASDKLADAVLTIESYDDPLPDIQENLEMILHIFSFDDYDFENDIDVKIDF